MADRGRGFQTDSGFGPGSMRRTVKFPRARGVLAVRALLLAALTALAAVTALFAFSASAASAAERNGAREVLLLNAALLTRDLGDPREPGNVKLVLALPGPLLRMTAGARPEDFRIYVHPADLPAEEGVRERYRARGVYLWRSRGRIFLDARTVPEQEKEGPATVRVVFAPRGTPLAQGVAEGQLSYTSDLVDVVLAVDVSRSMLYNDPQKRRVAAARAFIEMARQGGGIGSVGLVTFNHRAATNSPLLPLDGADSLIRLLGGVGADGLTNLDGPIQNSLRELESSRNPVIILLTDGRNEGSRYRDSHLAAAGRGARIFTVGLSEEADHELLKNMADTTDGIYFRAVTDSDLPEIYARLAAELGKRRLLNAETLGSEYGEKTYSIDATVSRLVALADGGAQIAAIGGGGMFTTGMSGVLTGRPRPGPWTFAWSNATPDVSTLALFGDTDFFLDVFPPQLLGDRLAVGATLARGDRALAGGRVWVEPRAGALRERLVLFDDGRHGDGLADDGVYAGETDAAGSPDRFDLTARADGTTWDGGEFVRQAAGVAIRVAAADPEAAASIGGDIDFGVLFPGETGSAEASIALDAPEPRDLRLELSWDGEKDAAGADGDWPDFASDIRVAPGTRAFQLEITIPESARPGAREGVFRVADGEGVDARSRARVVVGAVEFAAPEGVDLGDVPPGTFVSRVLEIPYRADKAAAVMLDVAGSSDIAAAADAETLDAGGGTLRLEIVVTAPLEKPAGEYAVAVRVAAGPGSAEIPVTWRVRPYAAAAPGFVPPEGLPSAPELPAPSAPLRKTPELSGSFWETDTAPEPPEPSASPWENTERLLHRPGDGIGAGAGAAGAPEVFTFPAAADQPKGASFWSAWWLYILAALLLLLLLLLLLAYILYRLGKSAMARFLLASALANIILLIAFVLLLGAGTADPAARALPVRVNLVEEDLPVEVTLSAAEESLLSGSAAGADGTAKASAGGGAAEAVLVRLLALGPSGRQLAEAREARLPEGEAPETEFEDGRRPAPMPLGESAERLRRTESPAGRNGRDGESGGPALAEMAEPAPAAARRAGASAADAETSEERPEIEDAVPAGAPERAADGRSADAAESAESVAELLPADAAGMEAVRHDGSPRRLAPRAGRRLAENASAVYPEPHAAIDDPVRDAAAESAAVAQKSDTDEKEPGAPEFRAAGETAGRGVPGEKPGAPLPGGAHGMTENLSAPRADGQALAAAAPALSRPAAARRASRSEAGREEPSVPETAASADSGSSASAGMRGGLGDDSNAAASAGAPGEERFDGGPAGGADGVPGGMGNTRTRNAADGGGGAAGAAPSPLTPGAAGSGTEEFVPAAGSGGGTGENQRRDAPAGGAGRRDAGAPSGPDGVPGGGAASGSPAAGGNGGAEDSSGRARIGGTGEERFDDRPGTDGGGAPAGRRIGSEAGADSADLREVSFDPGAAPYDGGGDEWRRNERRARPRSSAVAASAVEMDSLLLVVGDFARLPDPAAENLFDRFAGILGGGLTVEERRLSPADANLSDTLLALAAPEQIAAWSDADVRAAAEYLRRGGHIWLDADGEAERAAGRGAMERLAAAAGGEFAPLPRTHQLAGDGGTDALLIDGEPAAIATYSGWRNAWRSGGGPGSGDGTMRFLVRAVNYFLSGDADAGIVLEPGSPDGGTLVQPYREIIPDSLSSARAEREPEVWDGFGPETPALWRMPPWSDKGAVSAISDGQGGRAMKLDLGAAEKGRAAVYRTLRPPQDFGSVSAMTLEAYYDGAGEASLSMVFTVNEDGTWRDYETPGIRLEPGWNSVRFDLDGGGFRALTPGGAEDGALPEARARTGRAGFFLYRDGRTAAAALFRNIRTVRR